MTIYLDVPNRQGAWRAALAQRFGDRRVVGPEDPPAQIRDARHALVWKHAHGVFTGMPALEAVFVLGAGVEHTLGDPSVPRGIPIVRLHDAGMASQMVEYHLYAAWHYQREFDRYLIDQAQGRWHPRAPQPPLRVGVLGLGALGGAVARALIDQGFDVRGWTRSPRTSAEPGTRDPLHHGLLGIHAGIETLGAFLAATELLICLLPHTPATTGLLDRARLGQLPRGAAIINAGRGSLIDEAALLELLDSGHLRGAFLDVSAIEPLPSDHRLWRHPAVRITPHIAAATLIEASVDQVAANIARLERGLAPLGRVNLDAGY